MVDDSITVWIDRIRSGDEVAARKVWERFFDQLVCMAHEQLHRTSRRVADEEDAVVVAFDRLYRGLREGRFPQLSDRHDLWRLLIRITECTVSDVVRRPTRRQKRGSGAVRGDSVFVDSPRGAGFDQLVGADPTPDFVAQVVDTKRRLLECLSDDGLRNIATLKWEGYTLEEIAARQNCHARTIHRKLSLIRSIWEESGA